MTAALKLYWGSGSPYARRVQLYLIEKGLAFESHLIEFSKQEHKSEEFLKMNPRGKVPLLVDNTDANSPVYVYESLAIISYLERVYGPLYNTDDRQELARTFVRAYEVDQYFHSANGPIFSLANLWRKQESEWDLKDMKANLDILVAELKKWNEFCKGGKFMNGSDHYSIVDATFYPTLATIDRLGLELDEFELHELKTYYHTVSNRKSSIESIPPHWKGTSNAKYPILRQKLVDANLL